MNYKSTAMKCEECDYEFWADEPNHVKCPKCESPDVLIDQERDNTLTEKFAIGYDTC